MSPETTKSLEQCLPDGQLVNRAWLKERGFSRPRVDYALRAGKLVAWSHGIYRRPGPPLKWEHVVFSLNEMGYAVHVGGRRALELQSLAHYLHRLREGVARPGAGWDLRHCLIYNMARKADLVFARGQLAGFMNENNLPSPIYNYSQFQRY